MPTSIAKLYFKSCVVQGGFSRGRQKKCESTKLRFEMYRQWRGAVKPIQMVFFRYCVVYDSDLLIFLFHLFGTNV